MSPKLTLIKEKKEWQVCIEKIGNYDFYHTYDYHELSKSENETPILIQYEQGNYSIGLPFLLRPVQNTSYYDLTSVYGYAGPVSKNVDDSFDNTQFIEALTAFLAAQQIVSIFSRLNPLIPHQSTILAGLGDIQNLSKVVCIPMTIPVTERIQNFSKTTKRYINKSKKVCTITQGNSPKELEQFKALYYETMDRVVAKPMYYFSAAYFDKIVTSDDFTTEVLLVTHDETQEVICGIMVMKTNHIIQYHLSGTKSSHLYLTPLRLLIHEIVANATEGVYQYFNLGGGVGSAEDALFRFKSSFSKLYKEFAVWKVIVNEQAYIELSEKQGINTAETSFFPAYRSND